MGLVLTANIDIGFACVMPDLTFGIYLGAAVPVMLCLFYPPPPFFCSLYQVGRLPQDVSLLDPRRLLYCTSCT